MEHLGRQRPCEAVKKGDLPTLNIAALVIQHFQKKGENSLFVAALRRRKAKIKTKRKIFALIFFPNPDYITDIDSVNMNLEVNL